MNNALQAIHGVLIMVRLMAYEKVPHERIAEVLDTAELLPMLFIRTEDMTDEFRLHLEGLARSDPQFDIALRRFDDSPKPMPG